MRSAAWLVDIVILLLSAEVAAHAALLVALDNITAAPIGEVWQNGRLHRQLPRVWDAGMQGTAGFERPAADLRRCGEKEATWWPHADLNYDVQALMQDHSFDAVRVIAVPQVFASFEGIFFNASHYSVGSVASPKPGGLGDLDVDVSLYQSPLEIMRNMGKDPHFGDPASWTLETSLCAMYFSRQLEHQLLQSNVGWYDEMLQFYKSRDSAQEQGASKDTDLEHCKSGSVEVVARAGSTLGLYASNFFHWTATALPRAVALQRALGSTADREHVGSVPVLTVSRPFALAGIRALGLTPRTLGANELIFARELLVTEGLSQDWMESPDTVQASRLAVLHAASALEQKVKSPPASRRSSEMPRVLLISRGDRTRVGAKAKSGLDSDFIPKRRARPPASFLAAGGSSESRSPRDQAVEGQLMRLRKKLAHLREIEDEPGLLRSLRAALPKAEVESVQLAGLPFLEQVRLFNDADAVIGVDGAGLSNLIYAKPGAVVIDLQPAKGDLGLLPAKCGMNYFWHLAEGLRPGPKGVPVEFWSLPLENVSWHDSIQPPVTALVALLQKALFKAGR